MDVSLIVVGKTKVKFVSDAIEEYCKRLKRYINFDINEIPDIKTVRGMGEIQQKEKEGLLILDRIKLSDLVILLDEKGKEFTSVEFAHHMQNLMASGRRRTVFVVGGPYGFSDKVYERANGKISLSRMTFNHEMVRAFFIEQLYRAMTILRGEPYHHE